VTLAGTKQPSIDAAFEAGRKKIRDGDLAYQKQLASAYHHAMDQVMKESAHLATYIEQQKAKGAPVSPSWLSRQTRYLSLQSQLDAAIRQFGGATEGILESQRAASVRAGLSDLREEVLRASGLSSDGVPDLSVQAWGHLDKAAFEASMSTLLQNRSPLKQLIDQMGIDAPVAFQRAWAQGLAAGHNPKKIARNLSSKIQGLTQGRAQLIARTEWHRGVREARSQAFQKSRVVKRWIWRAALDGRTCGICYLMHGTEHLTEERLPGHPGCRCVMIPKTVDWSELGVSGIKNTRPPIEPGSSIFRRQPEHVQKRLIGKTRLEMFKNGTKLKDMVTIAGAGSKWGKIAKFKPLPPKIKGPMPAFHMAQTGTSIDFSTLKKAHEAMAIVTKHTNDIAHTLTLEESEAVSWYQGGAYRDFNKWARKTEHYAPGAPGNPFSTPAGNLTLIATYKEKLASLIAAVSKASTPESMLVWRGMKTKTQSLSVGSSFIDPAPMSTTTDYQTAENFAGAQSGVNNAAVIHLYLPSGSKAIAADVASRAGMGESEVLVAPGSKVTITKRLPDKVVTNYLGTQTTVPQYEGIITTP
jgi:SPP1 gp7 family putative phage head morphogenesis protein